MSGGTGFIQKAIDPLCGYLTTVTNNNRIIHDGKGYSVIQTIPTIAAAASYEIGFTTPASTVKEIHFKTATVSSSANIIRAEIFEAAAYTAGDEIVAINRKRTSTDHSSVTFKRGVTATTPESAAIVTAKAGGNFGNQPAGDAVDIVSDDNDLTQSCTIYGTQTGALTVVASETIAITGSAAVTTTATNWQTILGIELSASCAGTITVSESSGSAEITTIATTVLSAGVQTPTSTDGKLKIPLHDADGASTKAVGIIGTGSDGLALSAVDDLAGSTEGNHGTAVFDTITKVLIGDVASATDVTISVPNIRIVNGVYGVGGGPRSRGGGSGGGSLDEILKPSTPYVLKISNIGSSTATSVDIELFYCEGSQ